MAAITGKYSDGSNVSETITSELQKTYGSEEGKVTVTKNETNNSYEVVITGKGTYTIDANGKVEKSGPPVSYANERIVENSDGTGTAVAAGTKTPTTDKLYIYFEASVESGTTSISPSVPFEISQNGTYNFTITSTVNGETYTTTHSVTSNQYAVRAGIKIGDYITYTPSSSNTTTSVSFNDAETGYSSYSGNNAATLSRQTKFRVMDIDSEGNMELVADMASSPSTTIYFSGAQGYNNAVSVLNNKCSDLYKDTSKGITARSINEEDITKRFNSTGTGKMTAYIDERVGNVETETSNTLKTGTYIKSIDKTNKTVTYQDSGTNYRTYYPNIFQYEVGGKIGDTATSGALARSAKPLASLYGADEILTSADTGIAQSLKSDTTLTVPFTYSSTTHEASDFDYTDKARRTAYNSMFFGTGKYYWLASRCIICRSNDAIFRVRDVGGSSLGAYGLYYSYDYAGSDDYRVCPVVSIPSSVQVTLCTGTNDSTHPHTVVMTN